MISISCDKCGKPINTRGIESKPGNKVFGKDLCNTCFKKWLHINNGLEKRVFKNFVKNNIKPLKNITPGRLCRKLLPNTSDVYECPFCGKLYTTADYIQHLDKIEVGKEFECSDCNHLILLPNFNQDAGYVW